MTLRQIFNYPGGKRLVAPVINQRFGNVNVRVDAFTGSAAWILASEPVKYEFINDADGYVVNYLRAVREAPDELARYIEFPISELELMASSIWCKYQLPALAAKLGADPDFYDAKIAARWAYMMACKRTLASPESGPWGVQDGKLTFGAPDGTRRFGINTPTSLHTRLTQKGEVAKYLHALAARLKHVVVLWNDFEVVLNGIYTRGWWGTTGVLLDPPYTSMKRERTYFVENNDIWERSARWAVANGEQKHLRIAVCGYFTEQADAMFPLNWSRFFWHQAGGLPQQKRECIWFSPFCEGGE